MTVIPPPPALSAPPSRNPIFDARHARAMIFMAAINAARAEGRDVTTAIHDTARALGQNPIMNLELPPGH